MPRRPIAERVAEMQQRIEKLRQARTQLEARQAVVERKRQERRRYLLGSFLLERLDQDGPWRQLVRQELPGFLKEARDRQLFAELLDGKGRNGEAEIREPSPEALPTASVAPTEIPGVGLERHETG